MTTYTKDEIISSSIVSRNFGDILNRLNNREIEKVAVIRNNKIEAVILPVKIYEIFRETIELKEHIELYNTIRQREKNNEFVDFEAILKENGLTVDEI